MQYEYINLTPHEINIYDEDGENVVLTVPPSGYVARLEQTEHKHPGLSHDGIVVTSQYFSSAECIPCTHCQYYGDGTHDCASRQSAVYKGMKRRTRFIVSRMVADSCRDQERRDLFIPGPAVRDADGRVIGCRGLSIV